VRLSGVDYAQLLCDLLLEGTPVVTAVRGGSMWPFIPDGAVVRLVPVQADELRVGQVVVRRAHQGRVVVHRLSRRRGDDMETWGDGGPWPDGEGKVGEIIGRVVAIQEHGQWRPVVVRSPLRMRWRYVKRALRHRLGLADRPGAPPCEPDGGAA